MTFSSVGCKTVMVVEDDRDIRESLKDALEAENFSVVTACNGREALDALRSDLRPCLILLDLMMPIMGGVEFIDRLDVDLHLECIPVFVISAIADRSNSARATGYIKKPADLDVILATAHRYCGSNLSVASVVGP